jgi:hypothetical protein
VVTAGTKLSALSKTSDLVEHVVCTEDLLGIVGLQDGRGKVVPFVAE